MPLPIRHAARRVTNTSNRVLAAIAIAAIILTACGSSAAGPPRTINLATLNESGVTGTVTFSDQGDKTGVEVTVDPAGNLDMPAHIHPGTCADLTPQPKFPLENVRDGVSSTVVPASMGELFAGGLAVNIHRSNDDLKSYTACVDIR
jgi:hypothetical protein